MKKFLTLILTISMLLGVVGPLALPVSAEDTGYWYDNPDDFIESEGTITTKNGEAVFESSTPNSRGGQLYWRKYIPVTNSAVDVSWTMQIDSYSNANRETFAIAAGKYRFFMLFNSYSFVYRDEIGAGIPFSYPMGYGEHNFRAIVKNNGTVDFYDNGRAIVKDLVVQPYNTSTPYIEIGTYGGEQNQLSKMTIKNLTYKDYVEEGATAVTSGDPPPLSTPPEPFFYDFTEEEDLSLWRNSEPQHGFNLEEGIMYGRNPAAQSLANIIPVNFADEYVVEHKVRIKEYGDNFYYKIHFPGGLQHFFIREQMMHDYYSTKGVTMDPGFMGLDKWHIFRIESYNNMQNARYYIDDVLVGDFKSDPSTRAYTHLQIGTFGGYGATSHWEFDWIRYTPIWYGDASLAKPVRGDEYLEGEPIDFEAYLKEGVEADQVDYMVNGTVIATGTKENGYKATVTDLKPGSYTVKAVCNGTESGAADITVKPALKNELQVSKTSANQVLAQLKVYDEKPVLGSVDYYVNGVFAATANQAPYTAYLPVSATEGSKITAVCKDTNGFVLESLMEDSFPDLTKSGNTTHYSNEISYDVSGNGGSAVVDISNGMHQLKLTHTADQLTYATIDGEKTIATGLGHYTAITDGPFAEIYYQGKMILSFALPNTEAVTRTCQENGLKVTNFNLSIPEIRNNHLVMKNVTDKQKVYSLPGLNKNGGYYNIDFLAGAGDNVRLVMNDSIFNMDLTLRDGKLYAQTSQTEGSSPYELELCDLPASDGDIFYRVATAVGMTTVYANGKFLTSFRNIKAEGDGNFGIDVLGGDGLKYLAVNDYDDLYIYQDDFTNSGISDTEDYWYYVNDMSGYIDPNNQEMVLNSLDKVDAIAEVMAMSGRTELSADITVKQAKEDGGFWFILGKPTKGHYNKAGYNYATGEFEIVMVQEENGVVGKASVPGTLPFGETVHMEAKMYDNPNGTKADGKHITLYVNGKPMVGLDVGSYNGKVGFAGTNSVASVKNFSFRGDAKPMLDVRDCWENTGNEARTGSTIGFFEVDGRLYGTGQTGGMYSDDWGKSWYTLDMSGMGYPKYGAHVLRLNDGGLMSVYMNSGESVWGKAQYDEGGHYLYCLSTYRTEAGGETLPGNEWIPGGYIFGTDPEDGTIGYANTIHALMQGPDKADGSPGRVFYIAVPPGTSGGENYGTYTIYYSDDLGDTWIEGHTFNYEDMGYTIIQEPRIVATQEWVRVYYRNDKGMMRYFESSDDGVTWDSKVSYPTPFFMSLNCFGFDVKRTKDAETGEITEELYVSYSGDSNVGSKIYQYPRTNVRLAKSTDCGKTWQFMGTVYENVSSDGNNTNLNLHVVGDYVLPNAYIQNSTLRGSSVGRTLVTPIDKQVALVRDQRLHLQYPDFLNILDEVKDEEVQRTLVADPASGAAILRDTRIENVVVENGIDAACAASFIGATLVDNGATVTLKFGDSAETFDVTEQNGKKFIDLDALAEKYGMSVHELDGVKIISVYQDWSPRDLEAFRNAVNLFAGKTSAFEIPETEIQ